MSILSYEEERQISHLKELSKQAIQTGNILQGIRLYNQAWEIEKHAPIASPHDIYSGPRGHRGPAQYIYFLKDTENKYIKVGISNSPASRLQTLRPDCPFELEMIGSFVGSRSVESGIKKKFKEYHIRGEWFYYCTEIVDRINLFLKEGEQNG